MDRIEPNSNFKDVELDEKKAAQRTKIQVAITLLILSGLITLSYINDNIFIEYLAVCAFIISCICIIRLTETKLNN
ncbi:hypothetical protein BWZ20_01415 [Winogradskyella sp. J14-2]|uniref:hypothetical protein n=1 Tax=Winogradskyella sp. J14-2 TaxID=1936080 RepID=UPI000972A2A7|nr:hypothetical protein [Winogradskyella sp. J14-2]APY07039.1 hypothetical protein BWZ20_01415 [Winogradskyella sp. J14-2]